VSITLLHDWRLGDIVARYETDSETGAVALLLLPAARVADVVSRRVWLEEAEILEMPVPWRDSPARRLDSLVQLQCAEDERPSGYAQGRTLRNGGTTLALKLRGQTEIFGPDEAREIVTELAGPRGLVVRHHLRWLPGDDALETWSEVQNTGDVAQALELASSFSLDGVTPFDRADAPGRVVLHRFRGGWSSEGRLESAPVESLHLERGWQGHSVNVERFGQVGSLPARGFFPCAALEDTTAGVCWAAQLAWAGSWQMEVYRQGDCVAFSGGLADREFGHWLKRLAPGETLATPRAWLTVVEGDLDAACDRLVATRERHLPTPPAGEETLPVVFNEFCTSWGDPREAQVLATAERLRGTAVKYFVIDAGWYANVGRLWFNAHGDWNPGEGRFAGGLAGIAAKLRARGFEPGLWFEWETCGRTSEMFGRTEFLLTRDGAPVTLADRRFLDLRKPDVRAHLERTVLGRLREDGFSYVKFDYNETLGIGVDGAESVGEGLRRVIVETEATYARIAETNPGLVVELCASGGHRLEPSLLQHAHMGSFSDAHETPELPIIAAGLHRLVPVRQLQIWAVLRPSATAQRLRYTLAAGFLGRLCLSGDVCGLDERQWAVVGAALELYGRAAPVLRDGVSRRFGPAVPVWRHPRGWQAVVRAARDGRTALVVAHVFGGATPAVIEVALPSAGEWRMVGALDDGFTLVEEREESVAGRNGDTASGGLAVATAAKVKTRVVRWRTGGAFSGAAALFERVG
jgi:alpha-galactosidase